MDPSGHSFLSMISGAAGIALCVISYATPYRRWKVAASLGIGIFQIGIAWRDYTKAEKSIKRKYGKKSTKYRRIHNFNQTMFRLAVLSAGTTVVLSALGLKYKTLSNKIGIILLDFGLARSISLFGVTYDLASLLSAGVKRKKRMPFKSK